MSENQGQDYLTRQEEQAKKVLRLILAAKPFKLPSEQPIPCSYLKYPFDSRGHMMPNEFPPVGSIGLEIAQDDLELISDEGHKFRPHTITTAMNFVDRLRENYHMRQIMQNDKPVGIAIAINESTYLNASALVLMQLVTPRLGAQLLGYDADTYLSMTSKKTAAPYKIFKNLLEQVKPDIDDTKALLQYAIENECYGFAVMLKDRLAKTGKDHARISDFGSNSLPSI